MFNRFSKKISTFLRYHERNFVPFALKKINMQCNLVNGFSFQETFFVEFLVGNVSS